MNYTPTSGKAEIHLTYRCNLACHNCNRMSFLREPHTPDMTLEDVGEFLMQAQDLDWYPALMLIGGEPTLHPQFMEICALCRAFADKGAQLGKGYPGLQGLVQLWSNQQTEEIRAICEEARRKYRISVCYETAKPRSQVLSIYDIFVSPDDLGYGLREPCWQHSNTICGISVDANGYSPCAIGGAIDGILGVGCRTKRLADLFDNEKAGQLTADMCRHCGHDIINSGLTGVVSPVEWREKVAETSSWRAMKVSPTWAAAFEGRK